MKELIVIIGSILLGCIIFNMIAGDDMSLRSVSGQKMEEVIQYSQE